MHEDYTLNKSSKIGRLTHLPLTKLPRLHTSSWLSMYIGDIEKHAPSDRASVLARARKLEAEGRLNEAKHTINADITQNGVTAGLLWQLAEIENANGNTDDVVRHLADALELRPTDSKIASAHARALYLDERYAEAMSTILGFAPEVRRTPLNRATLGDIFRAIDWNTHAIKAYGFLGGLSLRAQYSCLISWLRCGGPFNLQHSSTWAFELKVKDNWTARSADHRRTLATVGLPLEREGHHISDDLENSMLKILTVRLKLQEYTSRSIRRPGFFGYLGFAWGLAFIALYSVERHTLGIIQVLIAALGLAELATLIFIPVNMMVTRFIARGGLRVSPQYLWWPLAIIATTQLLSISTTSLSWFIWLITLDIAFPSALWMSKLYSSYFELAHLREYHLRWLLLDGFLEILRDVEKHGDKSFVFERVDWISSLDDMAFSLENFFPRYVDSQDRKTRIWIAKRGGEAASSIRMLARSIAAPEAGDWEKIDSDLRHNILMVASGHFGALRPRPSADETQPEPGRIVITILRVAMVVVVLSVLIGLLVSSKNQKNIQTAITVVIGGTATALIAWILGPARREK